MSLYGLFNSFINLLNAELNPIRHLLALVGARHIVHLSRISVNIVFWVFFYCIVKALVCVLYCILLLFGLSIVSGICVSWFLYCG